MASPNQKSVKSVPKIVDPARRYGGDIGLLIRLMMEFRRPSFLFDEFYEWLQVHTGQSEEYEALVGSNEKETCEILTLCLEELKDARYLVCVGPVFHLVERQFADHAAFIASCREAV